MFVSTNKASKGSQRSNKTTERKVQNTLRKIQSSVPEKSTKDGFTFRPILRSGQSSYTVSSTDELVNILKNENVPRDCDLRRDKSFHKRFP